MDVGEIRKMNKLPNGKLGPRTWVAVISSTILVIGLALFNSHQVKVSAERYERTRTEADSLTHIQLQLILDAVLENRRNFNQHFGIKFTSDTTKAKEIDRLYMEKLKELK